MVHGLNGVLGVIVQSLVLGHNTLELARVITLRRPMEELIAIMNMCLDIRKYRLKRKLKIAMKIHVRVG